MLLAATTTHAKGLSSRRANSRPSEYSHDDDHDHDQNDEADDADPCAKGGEWDRERHERSLHQARIARKDRRRHGIGIARLIRRSRVRQRKRITRRARHRWLQAQVAQAQVAQGSG